MRVNGRRVKCRGDEGQWEKSKIAVDCKCRADEGQWEKSEIAVDCKCRGDEGQWEKSEITVVVSAEEMRVSGRRVR